MSPPMGDFLEQQKALKRVLKKNFDPPYIKYTRGSSTKKRTNHESLLKVPLRGFASEKKNFDERGSSIKKNSK